MQISARISDHISERDQKLQQPIPERPNGDKWLSLPFGCLLNVNGPLNGIGSVPESLMKPDNVCARQESPKKSDSEGMEANAIKGNVGQGETFSPTAYYVDI